jgi:pyruvate,orthophosphate dikinase
MGMQVPDTSETRGRTGARSAGKTDRQDFRRQGEAPLLVSVRSGSRESMPGMLDTVLNLGLNDRSVEALAAASGNRHLRL